jgi:hypothetical protein
VRPGFPAQNFSRQMNADKFIPYTNLKKECENGRGKAMPCPLEYIDVSQTLFELVLIDRETL